MCLWHAPACWDKDICVSKSDCYVVTDGDRSPQGKTKPEALANLAEALELYAEPDPAEQED